MLKTINSVFIFALAVVLLACGEPSTATFENPPITIDLLPRWTAEVSQTREEGTVVLVKYERDAMLKIVPKRSDEPVYANLLGLSAILEAPPNNFKLVEEKKIPNGFGGVFEHQETHLRVPRFIVYTPTGASYHVTVGENYRPYAIDDMIKMISSIR